jgi:uncharacterized membrane protein
MKALIAYVATLLAFLLLDGIWLGVLMAPTYRELLGSLMLEKPLLVPAAVLLPVRCWLRGVCGVAGAELATGGEWARCWGWWRMARMT